MNRKEYADFEKNVHNFMEYEGINCLTADGEPSFSWSSCDCCGTNLGGDRYDASGYNPSTKEVYEYIICPDCLYYSEYGQLDDMTMMDMKD